MAQATTSLRRLATAFSLVELLVVVTVIVILIALLTPALDRAMALAERTQCAATQHRYGVANFMYAGDNRHAFVPVKTPNELNGVSTGTAAAGSFVAWPGNAAYVRLIGLTPGSLVWPRGFACPSAKPTWIALGQGWRTLAFNWSGMAPSYERHLGIKRTKVPNPSDKAQMVDSNDWHAPAHTPYYRADYRDADGGWDNYGEVETGTKNAMVNYRHDEGANMHHFDGSVRYAAKEAAWKKDPGNDLTRERSVNARTWLITE